MPLQVGLLQVLSQFPVVLDLRYPEIFMALVRLMSIVFGQLKTFVSANFLCLGPYRTPTTSSETSVLRIRWFSIAGQSFVA